MIPVLGRFPGEEIGYPLQYSWAFLVAQMLKNPLAMWETSVQSLGWEDPLEQGTATHSSTPAWRTSWTEVPGGLQSVESQSRTQRRAEAQRPAVESLASAETAQELGQLWPTD